MQLDLRFSPYRLTAVLACCCALLLAACGPSATPTPTARPTEPPTEVQEEAETEAAEAEASETEASAEAAETEAAEETSATEEAEVSSEDEGDATEAAAGDEGDATEAADATSEAGGSAASGEGYPATVNVSTVRVRQEPSVAAAVMVEITRGTTVTALGQTPDAGYVQVQLEDGSVGWVAKQTLAFEDPRIELPVITP